MSPRRSPEYAAVLLIAQEAFPLDFRVWNCIDDRRQEIDFDRLLRDVTFTAKERLMLEIAASLWTSSNHSTLLRALAVSRVAAQRARGAGALRQ